MYKKYRPSFFELPFQIHLLSLLVALTLFPLSYLLFVEKILSRLKVFSDHLGQPLDQAAILAPLHTLLVLAALFATTKIYLAILRFFQNKLTW